MSSSAEKLQHTDDGRGQIAYHDTDDEQRHVAFHPRGHPDDETHDGQRTDDGCHRHGHVAHTAQAAEGHSA